MIEGTNNGNDKVLKFEGERKIIQLSDLINYEHNNKNHPDKQISALSNSIQEFGLTDEIIVDKDNIIIAGHGRLETAKKMGYTDVEVKVMDLSKDKARKLRLLHNKLAELAEDNIEAIKFEIEDLEDQELAELYDLDIQVIDEDKEVIEDDIPEVQENIIVEKGDIFQLGDHRLMCGDSTSIDDVEKLMDGEKADMVFTDPPYQIETKGGCKGDIGRGLKKQGADIDFISDFEPIDFLNTTPLVFEKNKYNAYIFCNKELLPKYLNWAVENKVSFNVLIWKKPNAIPIGDSHRPDIEYMLCFRKNAIWNNGLKNVNYSRCLEFGRETGLHPTMKPVGLLENELYISSNKGSNVIDFFGGSGSTLIACEKTGRKFYGIELLPKYIQVIIKRFSKYSDKPIKCITRPDLDIDSIIND